MDPFSDPFSTIQPDDALCCSVLEGDVPPMEDNILNLTARSPTVGLTRAITLAIRVKNVSAIGLLGDSNMPTSTKTLQRQLHKLKMQKSSTSS